LRTVDRGGHLADHALVYWCLSAFVPGLAMEPAYQTLSPGRKERNVATNTANNAGGIPSEHFDFARRWIC
jgi:hypothetical protein